MKRSGPPTRRTPLRRRSWLRPRRGKRLLPLQTREALRERARGRCERCHRPDHKVICQAHHKRLRSQGGSDEPDNLAYLCSTIGTRQGCHQWVHDNPAEAARDGWIIRSVA
jgi:5-methylcytosine-specific restriction endonuclease McrA